MLASCHHHGHALRERGEGSHRRRSRAEKSRRNSRHKRRERRIGNVTPLQVPRVVERGQFVAMIAVLPVGERVKQKPQRGEYQQGTSAGGGFIWLF